MAIGSWWLQVRRRLVWEHETPPSPTAREGARAADRQGERLTGIDWFGQRPASQPSDDAHPSQPDIPVADLGHIGLPIWEERMLAEWAGSHCRLLEVFEWVCRAHKRLEMLHFPNNPGGANIAMLRDVHPRSVEELARLLRSAVGMEGVTVEQIRSLFKQRLPGLLFPNAASRAELEKLLAIARNLNWWLAGYGTLPCGCPPMAMGDI